MDSKELLFFFLDACHMVKPPDIATKCTELFPELINESDSRVLPPHGCSHITIRRDRYFIYDPVLMAPSETTSTAALMGAIFKDTVYCQLPAGAGADQTYQNGRVLPHSFAATHYRNQWRSSSWLVQIKHRRCIRQIPLDHARVQDNKELVHMLDNFAAYLSKAHNASLCFCLHL